MRGEKINWKEVDEYLNRYDWNVSIMDICDMFNLFYSTVHAHYKKLGLINNFKKKRIKRIIKWEEIDKEVIPNIEQYSETEIAKKYNLPPNDISRHYSKLGLNIKFKRSSKYDWYKIDREVIPNIENITMKEVSNKYNVPYYAVRIHYCNLHLTKQFKPFYNKA